jgi:hypothetical protein
MIRLNVILYALVKVREGIQHIIRKRRSAMYEDSRSSTEHHKKVIAYDFHWIFVLKVIPYTSGKI